MRAIVCKAIADDIGTLTVEDIELPPVGPGQARVRILAAAVLGHPDGAGPYQHKPLPSPQLAGDVIAVGAACERGGRP